MRAMTEIEWLDGRVTKVPELALGDALLEFLGFAAQCLVAELFVLGLHRVDARHGLAVLLEQPVIAAAEYFGEEVGGHASRSALHCPSKAAERPESLR